MRIRHEIRNEFPRLTLPRLTGRMADIQQTPASGCHTPALGRFNRKFTERVEASGDAYLVECIEREPREWKPASEFKALNHNVGE